MDNCNHTFDTQKWGASHISDMKNWSKFSAFSELYMAGSILGSRCVRSDPPFTLRQHCTVSMPLQRRLPLRGTCDMKGRAASTQCRRHDFPVLQM